MKRVRLCVVILVILGALSTAELFILKNVTKRLSAAATSAIESAARGDFSGVAEMTDCWERYQKYIAFAVHSDKSGEFTKTIARLEPLAQSGSDEIEAELRTVKYLADWIYEGELPTWYNIL